jgi:phage terminase small subunit
MAKSLTDKQRLFVYFYLGDSNRNATDAARRAGYGAPNTAGPRLLVNVRIRSAVAKEVVEAGLAAHEILARLAEQATASMDDFVTMATPVAQDRGGQTVHFLDEQGSPIAEPMLDLAKARRRGKLHLIKKLTPTRQGLGIELYSAQDALVRLGMYHALWAEKVKLDLQGQDLESLSIEELLTISRGKVPDRLSSSN